MNNINIEDISIFYNYSSSIIGEDNFIPLKQVSSILDAKEDSLVFINSSVANKESLIVETKAKVIICDILADKDLAISDKCLIIVSNPKLVFAKIVNGSLAKKTSIEIHPTAIIDENAKIGKNVSIGAYVCIGKSEIGDGAIIYPHVSIYDNVRIGKNVIIDSGAVIGSSGFGFVRDELGVPVSFPQLGGVVIGDNVEIGANTCIDGGALQDTVIGNNTKIDNFSQISHNCLIGDSNYIIGARIAGSVVVGNNCWIGPSSIINKAKLGNNITIGFGATVLANVKTNAILMGSPATNIEKYSKIQYQINKLIKK